MIKRRTKRQQQKGRKEPKAKRKLNKRMLKKKTTLKMEIPKLMRYFSSTKSGNRARCAGSTAAGPLLGSRGWGVTATLRTEQLWYLPRAAPRESLQEWLLLPAPSCSVLEPFRRCCLLALVPLGTAQDLRNRSPGTSSPSSPELTLHIPSGLLGSSAAQHGFVLGQKSGFEFYTIL